ncbi:GNAT family N-acetyltransferase [Neofamilia massiliensis]|uniref:GNAT family N-acetyltransferase n=1 Tax=Neofamilia massiliensis TaxID=1673724 RepID=UPI0006BB92BD|nr:N-acetyltransferase [Neofamilia massiliensis]
MDIIQEENRFFIGNPKEPLAQLSYKIENKKIIINNIEVVSHLKGQGIASDLLKRLLIFAKENNYYFDPKFIETTSRINEDLL